MAYVRRTPVERCRWTVRSATTLPLEWSDELAYVVGLTATDGCLVTGRRKINLKSVDRDLVATYLGLLGRTNPIKKAPTRTGGIAYYTEFGDARLYRWFQSVGITPRKSLTLGALAVPDRYLLPVARGLLDGDGHISNFIHRPTLRLRPRYEYERIWTYFNSASRPHLEWLQTRLRELMRLDSYLEPLPGKERKHPLYRLKFGNRASIKLLHAIYPDPDVPCLERKRAIWLDYARRHGITDVQSSLPPT
jgi:hypothetical protein